MSARYRERWPEVMGKDEACAYLHIGKTDFNHLVNVKKIKQVRHHLQTQPRYKREDLDRYVEQMEYIEP